MKLLMCKSWVERGEAIANKLSMQLSRVASCMFTFNVKDFVLLHNDYVISEKEHFGIIVSPQLPIGEALRRLLALLQRSSHESIKNVLEFL